MKTKYLLAIVAFICLSCNLRAQSPDWVWAKGMLNPAGAGDPNPAALARDAMGNIYATGGFTGTIDFDPGPGIFLLSGDGAFILKLDSSGNFIWAMALTGMVGMRSIALDDSCNIYVSGSINDTSDMDPGPGTYYLTSAGWSDICFAKFDSSGNFNWAHHIGGISFDYSSTIMLGKGEGGRPEVYIAGSFGNATVDFDPGPGSFFLNAPGSYCMFVAKFSSSGDFLWAKAGGGYNSYITTMSFDPTASGAIYIAGTFTFTVDFDMGPGVLNLTAVGLSDIFVSKIDSVGNFIWAKQMGGSDFDEAYSIAVNTSGDVYTTGYFNTGVDFDPGAGTYNLTSNGGDDIFISKLNSSGNFIWAKAIGGFDFDNGSSIALGKTGSEDPYVTGTFVDTVDFDPGPGVFNLNADDIFGDIYIVRLDSAGNLVWAKQAGGPNCLESSGPIVLDVAGNAYTTGKFFGDTVMFGPITLFNTGTNNEMYVARLDASVATGMNEVSSAPGVINIFPNPFSSFTTLQSSTIFKDATLTVYNIYGQQVKQLNHLNGQAITFYRDELTSGMYFIQMTQDAKIISAGNFIITE